MGLRPYLDVTRVLPAHEGGDLRHDLAPHGVGRAQEQRLHLVVVETGEGRGGAEGEGEGARWGRGVGCVQEQRLHLVVVETGALGAQPAVLKRPNKISAKGGEGWEGMAGEYDAEGYRLVVEVLQVVLRVLGRRVRVAYLQAVAAVPAVEHGAAVGHVRAQLGKDAGAGPLRPVRRLHVVRKLVHTGLQDTGAWMTLRDTFSPRSATHRAWGIHNWAKFSVTSMLLRSRRSKAMIEAKFLPNNSRWASLPNAASPGVAKQYQTSESLDDGCR